MLYQHENSVGKNFYECIQYHDFYYVPHMHRHPELIYVREGEVLVESSGGCVETIGKGEYALVLPNCIHGYTTPNHSLVDVCIFSQDYASSFFKDVRGKKADRTRFLCRPAISELVTREMFVTDRAPDLYLMKSMVYAVLHEYHNQVTFSKVESKNELLLNQIVGYVEANYTEDITLKGMGEALGYEPHYLSRYFHDRIPMHFSKYVNWYRVDMATELLRNTELPITEIAARSGFQSLRSFNRVYRDFTGITPSEEVRLPLGGAHQSYLMQE